MIHALMLALLVTGAAEKHPVRPKHPTKHVAPKPPPPPPEPEEPDAPEEPDVPMDDDADTITEPDALDPPGKDEDVGMGSATDVRLNPQYSEKELQAIGAASLCCCFLFVAGLVVLVVWLVRRASGSGASKPSAPGPTYGAPPPAAAPPPAQIPFHLSVLAVGMHASARQLVAQQLILAGAQADPVSAPERAQLVRELSKAVRGLETEWTQFGYGERLDLADDASAQRSYQLAVEDFSRRSAEGSLSGESTYVVMTLVLCTRRQLRGVSALDDRAQIRALLDERSVLGDADLMGAYIAWSAPLGGHEVLSRFPEMHAVR